MIGILKSLFLTNRLFALLALIVVLFVLGYFYPLATTLARPALATVVALTLLDGLLLYRWQDPIHAVRETGERFSNGDDNDVEIVIGSRYPFPLRVVVIDELPPQFQIRDHRMRLTLRPGETKRLTYRLRPVSRGEYWFGVVNVYAHTPVGLVSRRFRCGRESVVAVYPSYQQMRHYALLAISNRLTEVGVKRIRKVGRTLEFDRIRTYVQGDDYRTINWKATARRAEFMVNEYQDERAQHVYCLINQGRVMKMPFEGMTLLDYAINASLVLANIAIQKGDRAGILTFSHRLGSLVPADRRPTQMFKILETLYRQTTDFPESNYELLYTTVRRKINKRSLLLLFTNFETLAGLKRQLPFLRQLARHHLLLVVFFENTELRTLLVRRAQTSEEVYVKTVAEKFIFEKRQIVKQLSRHGVHAILTTPKNLTPNSVNKYLEFKALGLI